MLDEKASVSSSNESPRYIANTVVTDHYSTNVDPERLGANTEVDPFHFKGAFKSSQEIDALRKRKRGRRLAAYHATQNNLINSLLKSMEAHTEDARIDEAAARLPVKIAVWASLIANLCLCILQLYAAISSLSLSLLATAIDAVFDIGSNILLFWLHRKAENLDSTEWPVGGARLETIGNIVYGFLMGSVNLVVIVESAQSLITKTNNDLKQFHLPSILAVAAALAVKLLLFLYCFSLRNKSSQVRVLWEDHRNDLWINTFGILMSTGGSKLRWWLDPTGAIIIALGVTVSWCRTIYSQFELLAGKSASHEFLQLLIYKSLTFNEQIIKLDTARAYHSGPDYFVEIDIVMDTQTPLWKAHDVSQALQEKLEALPNVERAFVHVDYETTHTPVSVSLPIFFGLERPSQEHRKPPIPRLR
ncbi:Metal tolerance protein 3 [Mycena indigotica]|uniref:Metal tolerance protein 3 n=1 Tax=Mycena indigotica TaxID=2126181 RepID=A0A8H6SY08_9AGAR|nr:Metal tolerance protein 3 [Mycena indigotica]KAF7307230.1 Metal tolerance protein 3 [Mycena indigotica]